MEKVKVCGPMHPKLYHYEWQLTREEKKKIRDVLKGIEKRRVESFISYLQGLCGLKKMLLEQPQRSEVRTTRERILTDCRAALEHLKRCEKLQAVTWYDETINPFWSYKPEQKKVCPECKHPFTTSGQREKCVQCDPTSPKAPPKGEDNFLVQHLDSAWAAVGPLEKFITVLERYHKAEKKKTGRREADNDHFVRKIRDIYSEHIGKPTLYEDGPFFAVVRAALEIFDLPSAYPAKAIREALMNRI